MSQSSTARNLDAIVSAIKQHNKNCKMPATSVALNPYEHERLGFPEIMGIPTEPDENLPTGRFHIHCDAEKKRPGTGSSTSTADKREAVKA